MISKLSSVIAGILLLGLGLPCEAQNRECKSICKEIRQEILQDVSVCLPSAQVHPIPKVFKACIDGRKKAFDQACVSTCTSSKQEFSSFEGCKSVVHKHHGPKFVDWCRKGFESIIDAVESALVDHRTEGRELKQQADVVDNEVEIRETEQPVESDVELDEQDAYNLILHAESSEDSSVALPFDDLETKLEPSDSDQIKHKIANDVETKELVSSSKSDVTDRKIDDVDGLVDDKESAEHHLLRRQLSYYQSDTAEDIEWSYETEPEF